MDLLTIFPQQTAVEVHLQFAGPQKTSLRRPIDVTPPEDRPDPREQFAKQKRLGHIIVRPRLESLYFVVLMIAYGDHQNTDARSNLSNAAAALNAADPRHVDVQKHQIYRPLLDRPQRGFSIAGLFRRISNGAQRGPEDLSHNGL